MTDVFFLNYQRNTNNVQLNIKMILLKRKGGYHFMNNFYKTIEDVGMKIFKLYCENKLIYISYLENNNTNNIRGIIKNVNFVEKEIIMIPQKKISFKSILNIYEIS